MIFIMKKENVAANSVRHRSGAQCAPQSGISLISLIITIALNCFRSGSYEKVLVV